MQWDFRWHGADWDADRDDGETSLHEYKYEKKKHKCKIVTITKKKNASETVEKYLNLKNLKKGK